MLEVLQLAIPGHWMSVIKDRCKDLQSLTLQQFYYAGLPYNRVARCFCTDMSWRLRVGETVEFFLSFAHMTTVAHIEMLQV